MSTLLTPEQVCEKYSIKLWTLYQWTAKKFIPHLKIRGLLRFREQDLDAWNTEHLVNSVNTKLL
ncbi:MAG TPA: excisionase [Candidatus Omnitrophica bacterium]|nr:excisionase [Candidatus Omnitrophota bacterium]